MRLRPRGTDRAWATRRIDRSSGLSSKLPRAVPLRRGVHGSDTFYRLSDDSCEVTFSFSEARVPSQPQSMIEVDVHTCCVRTNVFRGSLICSLSSKAGSKLHGASQGQASSACVPCASACPTLALTMGASRSGFSVGSFIFKRFRKNFLPLSTARSRDTMSSGASASAGR